MHKTRLGEADLVGGKDARRKQDAAALAAAALAAAASAAWLQRMAMKRRDFHQLSPDIFSQTKHKGKKGERLRRE